VLLIQVKWIFVSGEHITSGDFESIEVVCWLQVRSRKGNAMGRLTGKQIISVQKALDSFDEKVRAAMRLALVESRSSGDKDASADVHDIGDESVADELMALNSALAERHGQELQQIERARQRINNGEIGVCVDCDGDISIQRLIANPVAERCIECESKHERAYAHAATPRL
jgi:RNA polymerase-binding protein DksA